MTEKVQNFSFGDGNNPFKDIQEINVYRNSFSLATTEAR